MVDTKVFWICKFCGQWHWASRRQYDGMQDKETTYACKEYLEDIQKKRGSVC